MPLKRISPDMTNSKTLVTGKSREFSDIDLSFNRKPGSLVWYILYVAPTDEILANADESRYFSDSDEARDYAEEVEGLNWDLGEFKVQSRRIGDIYKKQDVAAVIQSVSNILMTNYNEKPFNPDFGGNLRSMLFENKESYSESFIRERIIYAIETYESRAIIEDVKFFDEDGLSIRRGSQRVLTHERNSITITVEFRIETDGEIYTSTVNMNRLR